MKVFHSCGALCIMESFVGQDNPFLPSIWCSSARNSGDVHLLQLDQEVLALADGQ